MTAASAAGRPATEDDVCPIRNEIGQVFIPVRDLAVSLPWYRRLLGVTGGAVSHEGTIADLGAVGPVGLALDATQPDVVPDGPPRFFWWAEDLAAVRTHLVGMDVPGLGDVEDIGSVSLVQFSDPDGNRLMVCARNRGRTHGDVPQPADVPC